MAWTVAVIVAVIALSGILILINKGFDKAKQGIKVFLTLLSAATLILLAGVMKVIVDNKASGTMLVGLQKLSTVAILLTSSLFAFLSLYFTITYTVGVFRAVKGAKQEKEEFEWNAV